MMSMPMKPTAEMMKMKFDEFQIDFDKSIQSGWNDLKWALYLCIIYFGIPIDYICKIYGSYKAKRIYPDMDSTGVVDILLFTLVCITLEDIYLLGTTEPILPEPMF